MHGVCPGLPRPAGRPHAKAAAAGDAARPSTLRATAHAARPPGPQQRRRRRPAGHPGGAARRYCRRGCGGGKMGGAGRLGGPAGDLTGARRPCSTESDHSAVHSALFAVVWAQTPASVRSPARAHKLPQRRPRPLWEGIVAAARATMPSLPARRSISGFGDGQCGPPPSRVSARHQLTAGLPPARRPATGPPPAHASAYRTPAAPLISSCTHLSPLGSSPL
jgi:hypothetical protein